MILTPPGYHAIGPGCVLNPLSCAAKAIGGAAVKAVGSSVFDAFSNWLSSGASWLVGQVFNVIVGSDAPHSHDPVSVTLTAGWFVKKDSLMLLIAMVVLCPLLLAATIGAVLRQDLGRLARTWLVGLPVAVVLGFTSVAVTDLGVHVCDDLSHMVLGRVGPDTAHFFVHLAAAPAEGPIPTVITALLSVLLLIGAVLLWLEML
ncbi:MAG: hypothetical protein J2P57_13650, partial [Acidimicrobiaceae bacterium]|nr:hypothetical protein [Acidimicrobiaceae bacterium]